MKRYGMAIRIKQEFIEKYISLHKTPDNELLLALENSNIHNNTVFLIEGLLFSYFEYRGDDFEADWTKYTTSNIIQKLFNEIQGFFLPIGERFPKRGWSEMKEVFRKD